MRASVNTPVKLRHLKIYCIGSLAGLIAFFILAILANELEFIDGMTLKTHTNKVVWITGGICLLVTGLAYYVYGKKTDTLRRSSAIGQEKLNQYRLAISQYIAMVELPAIVANVTFFMTGNYWILVFVMLAIAAMIQKFPTRQRVITDAGLDWQEQDLLT